MRNIIIDIEKEIEEQLNTKTEDNDFTTTNVKGILKVIIIYDVLFDVLLTGKVTWLIWLKELIVDEDIKEMVRQTLHPGDRADCYEPKLTRAKVRYVWIIGIQYFYKDLI